MSDVAAPRSRVPRGFLAALALLTAAFIALAVARADRATLRGDEVVTLYGIRDGPGIAELMRRGAPGQVSPAPLFYVPSLLLDRIKGQVDYFGLRPSGYFRLPSVLFTAVLGAASAWLMARHLRRQEPAPSPVAYFLVLCAVAVYWSQPKMFAFACLDRPYALWNGLWLLSLTVFLVHPKARLAPAILLSLMAATAIPAFFQIAALGSSFYAIRRREGGRARDILSDAARIFTAPVLIAIYYATRTWAESSDGMTVESETIPALLRFWMVTNLHAWLAAAVSAFLVWKFPRLRPSAIPVAAFCVLLVIVPVIFGLATRRGFTNPSRYYIWTTTALPLAILLAAQGWTELRAWAPARKLVPVLAGGLVLGFSAATLLRPAERHDSRRLACFDPGSSLDVLLRKERPFAISFYETLGPIERSNLRLVGEWIEIRYARLPVALVVVPFHDANGELISEPPVPEKEFHRGLWLIPTCH
jgi:hypothetical protein